MIPRLHQKLPVLERKQANARRAWAKALRAVKDGEEALAAVAKAHMRARVAMKSAFLLPANSVPEAVEMAERAAVAWSEVLAAARNALEAARATLAAARAAFLEASLAVAEADRCAEQVRAELKEEEKEVAALVKSEATAARRRRRDGD
jgi:hypothetical protein